MPVTYSDPWKDDPYGKLKGEKQDAYFQVSFDEARVYSTETGYIICAYMTGYSGVVRAFKPENGLEPGLCQLPIHETEYETREKVLGEWNTVKHQPSKYEKALCEHIHKNETLFLSDSIGIKGSITFIPDGMCGSLDETALAKIVTDNVSVEPTGFTGKLPAYTPPKPYRKGGGSWGGSSRESSKDKLAVLKKELASFSENDDASETDDLGTLVMQIWSQHVTEEDFLTHYFDVLTAVVR